MTARLLIFAFLTTGIAPNDFAEAAPTKIIFEHGANSAEINGKLSTNSTALFSFVAREGQHLQVDIVPVDPGLITAGQLIYPSKKRDGGPGGTIFDGSLSETGRYVIRVSRRQGSPGRKFTLKIELK